MKFTVTVEIDPTTGFVTIHATKSMWEWLTRWVTEHQLVLHRPVIRFRNRSFGFRQFVLNVSKGGK